MFTNKPILVLGSNSFSGSSFINCLLSNGHKVIGTSRSEEIIQPFNVYKQNSNAHNFIFKKLDINSDEDKIVNIVDEYEVEIIFNFVAQSMVEQSWQFPDHWYKTNVLSLVKLTNSLKNRSTVKRFIQFTTPEVYGSTTGWVKESFNFMPSTPYAVSRAAGDLHLKCLFEAYKFPVIFTRAANVYGPGQRLYRIIPKAFLAALTGRKLQLQGGGTSVRSFIHIDDISRGLNLIMEKGIPGSSYHLSTDNVISIIDLVKEIASMTNIPLRDLVEITEERVGKDQAYLLQSTKIRNELGWQDKISVEQGLEDVHSWIKSNLEFLSTLSNVYEHKK